MTLERLAASLCGTRSGERTLWVEGTAADLSFQLLPPASWQTRGWVRVGRVQCEPGREEQVGEQIRLALAYAAPAAEVER